MIELDEFFYLSDEVDVSIRKPCDASVEKPAPAQVCEH